MPQANPTGGSNSERLENVTFPQARIDLNDNLEALQTLNSGNSEPSTKAAFMQWLDTNTDPAVLKIRNAGNTDWVEVGSLSATEYASKGLTAIANGGTGQVTAAAAIAALLPSQGGNSGKSLTTDGSAFTTAGTIIGLTGEGFIASKNFRIEADGDAFFTGTLNTANLTVTGKFNVDNIKDIDELNGTLPIGNTSGVLASARMTAIPGFFRIGYK